MVITPTIGRIVWYFKKDHKPGEQPQAAIVTYVWSDTCVNLSIFSASGNPEYAPPTSILLVQEGSEAPSGGHYCTWMPYQVGQAKKHAADK